MKKYIGVIVMMLFAGTTNAQILLKGGVREKGSGKKLSDVFVKDNNNKEITLTDKNGNYAIRAITGHLLIFSSPGYISDTLYLVNTAPKFVELQSMPTSLGEVNVRSSRVAFDPRSEYPDVYEKAKIYPLSPSTIFSRESRNARKLKKYFAHEEQDRYIDDTYSKLYVGGIVPLKGKELEDFMSMSRPSYAFLRKTSGAELLLYVNDSYRKFKALPPDQRSSPQLSGQ